MKLYNVFYDEKYPEDENLFGAEMCFYCINPEVPAAEADYISDLTESQADELIERLSCIYPSFFYYKKEIGAV